MNSIVTLFRRCALVVFAIGALGWTSAATGQSPGLFELWVGHELVDCPSDPARLCYQVKREQYEDWSVFEGSIGNFYYREGVAYILLVEMDPSVDDAEPRRTRYKVVQVLEEFETFAEPEIPDRIASSAAEPTETEIALQPVAAHPPPSAPEPVVADPLSTAPAPVEQRAVALSPTPSRTTSALGKSFRGILIIGSGTEARSFTPCGEEGGVWIEDESAAGLWKVYRDLVEAPNRPLFIDVRGELGSAPSTGFGAYYERQLTVIEVVRVDAENTDCAEGGRQVAEESPATPIPERPEPVTKPTTEPPQVLIAGGPPLWTLSIGSSGIVYTGPMGAESIRFPYASPIQSANRTSYATSASGSPPHTLKVVVDREPCPDVETGVRRDFTAYVTLNGRWLRGCVTDGDPLSPR